MAKVTELKKEQEARFGEFVQKWTRIGRVTEPADRPTAEHWISEVYRLNGLDAPKFVWCANPEQAVLLREKQEKKEGLKVNDPLQDICWGQHDAGLFAFYDFFREVGGVIEETNDVVPHMMVAQAAGWWLPSRDICWVVERPMDLHLDEEGRMHNEEGPALEYPDGWSMFLWHGITVPEDIIMDRKSITAKRIFGESNAEVRRAMVSLFGMDKWIEESGAKKMQEDKYGELFEVDFEGNGRPERFVRVVNGTPDPDGSKKLFVIPVLPEHTTAHQAVAWTFGKTPETYNPSIRT